MFEGILERILQKALGQYIEGLDKNNLKLGVWSGNINLENVYVKKTIFEMLKLPLTLRLGRIGKLQLVVPWRSLSSSPVEIVIKGVSLIICPKTKEEWELLESVHTNFEMREQMIKDFAVAIFNQLIKSEESEQLQQGFLKNLSTRILDNVQVSIQNIHVRLESYEGIKHPFAMGFTLKEIAVQTTNQEWKKEFFDRTSIANKDKPVFKVLSITKFGIYWITDCEEFFARDFPGDDQENLRLQQMKLLYGLNDDYAQSYKDQDLYLLKPISLVMKLKQVTSQAQLTQESEFKISLEIDDFSIYLQKSQYDNIFNLMELFDDYSKYQAQYQQTRRYRFLRPNSSPQEKPEQWFQFAATCIIRELKAHKTHTNQFILSPWHRLRFHDSFNQGFSQQLEKELLLTMENSDKKRYSKYLSLKQQSLFNQSRYHQAIMAIDQEQLKEWAHRIASEKAEEFKRQKDSEKQSKTNNTSSTTSQNGVFRIISSFGISSWLSSSAKPAETEVNPSLIEESKSYESDDEFFDAIDDESKLEGSSAVEKELDKLGKELYAQFADESKLVSKMVSKSVTQTPPMVEAEFKLRKFSVSLVNNRGQHEGIELFSTNFTIKFMKYDSNSESSPSLFTLVATNQEFGANQFMIIDGQIFRTSIIERENSNFMGETGLYKSSEGLYVENQTEIRVYQGNPNYRDKTNDFYDFDLSVRFEPIKIIYQVLALDRLFKFLKVEQFNDQIKQQAIQRIQEMRQNVNLRQVLENKKRNRLKIDIASPILVIPFKRNNDIQSECWLFNMGTVKIENCDEPQTSLDLSSYKNYNVKISQIMMKYVKSYRLWIERGLLEAHSVIDEFQLDFVLSLIKQKGERPSDLIIQGNMSDLKIFFTPHIYNQIANIDKLLVMDEKIKNVEMHQLQNEKAQVIKMAQKIGQVKVYYSKKDILDFYTKEESQWEWESLFAVVSGAYIYFYEKSQDAYPKHYFYLSELKSEKTQDDDGQAFLELTNVLNQVLYLQLNSSKHEQDWITLLTEKSLELTANVIQSEEVKQAPAFKRTQSEVRRNEVFSLNEAEIKQNDLVNQDQDEASQMEFHFQIPVISVLLKAQKPEEGDVSNDIGLFEDIEAQGEQQSPFTNFKEKNSNEKFWQTELKIQSIIFDQIKRPLDSEMRITMDSFTVQNPGNLRFPELIYSKISKDSTKLFEVNIIKQDRSFKNYQGIDMLVDLEFGSMHINWYPKNMNRLLKFFKYMKIKSQVVEQEKEKYIYDLKKSLEILQQTSKNHHHHHHDNQQSKVNFQEEFENCINHPNKGMEVKMRLKKLGLTLIHPINDTYPISTISLGGLDLNYITFHDHDQLKGSVQDIRMMDNTNYPMTLDPNQQYFSHQKIPKHEILGPRSDKETQLKSSSLIIFDITQFHSPLKNDCPLQKPFYHNNVKLTMSSIKFNFLNEWVMRLNDYMFNQLLAALSDANPYQKLANQVIDKMSMQREYIQSCQTSQDKKEIKGQLKHLIAFSPEIANQIGNFSEAFQKLENKRIKYSLSNVQQNEASIFSEKEDFLSSKTNYMFKRSNNLKNDHHQKHHFHECDNFNESQQKSCSFLDITLDSPLVILKDRPYLQNKVEIDLGKIKISSSTQEVPGRWKSMEDRKVWTTKFIVEMNEMGIKLNNEFEIASPFTMKVQMEKLNYTPMIEDGYMSPKIDFTDLDISYKISVHFSPVIMHLKQDVFTYLMRCNDLNINHTDQLSPYFQLAIWNNGQDTQRYLKQEKETVGKFKNKQVYKMKVNMHLPSLSLQIHNKDNLFLAELIYWGAEIDFLKFIDYRKDISFKTHTFFILYSPTSPQTNPKMKQVAIAPVNSRNLICTDDDFYNFEVKLDNFQAQSLSPSKAEKQNAKLQKKNFIVNLLMEADGEKLVQVRIEKLKIMIKPHIFMTIAEVIMYGMPQYRQDSRDKPYYYDFDWGNSPKMEVQSTIMNSLLCFEVGEGISKTIACQGNTNFTYIREKMNQIKQKLTDIIPQEETESMKKGYQPQQIDSSSTYKLMQVSISDMCPFFCHQTDLYGKKFKQVRKREMMSPFTLFFNKNDVIELCKNHDRSNPFERYVFKTYSKTEANLERTLLKISFNDIKVLKSIADHMTFMLYHEYERLIKEQGDGNHGSALGHGGQLNSTLLNQTRQKLQIYQRPNVIERIEEPVLMEEGLKTAKQVSLFGQNKNNGLQINLNQSEEREDLDYEESSESKESIKTESDLSDDEKEDKVTVKFKSHEVKLAGLQNNMIKRQTLITRSAKQQRHLHNITESVKRTSIAFNLVSEQFLQRNLDFNSASKFNSSGVNQETQKNDPFQSSFDEFIFKNYIEFQKQNFSKQQSQHFMKFTPSNEASPDGLFNKSNCQSDDNAEDIIDVDEGDRAIFNQESINILRQDSPVASKRLRRQMKIEEEEEKVDKQPVTKFNLIKMIKEEKGVNEFQIVSYGLKVLIINDSQQNFFPVLGISISEFHYNYDMNETQKAGQTQFSISINYYNAQAGEWEPFIETFRIHFTIMEEFVNKKSIFQCELPTNFNMNISQKLVENLSHTYKSWQKSISDEKQQEQIQINLEDLDQIYDEASLQEEDDENYSYKLMGDRGGTNRTKNIPSSSGNSSSTNQNNSVGNHLSKSAQGFVLDDEEDDMDEEKEEVVTPYSIQNLTNVQLVVKRITNQLQHETYQQQHMSILKGNNLMKMYVIKPAQKIDYAVDYELQVKQQISMYSQHSFSQGEFIKVLFTEYRVNGAQQSSMMTIPLDNVNLNQIGYKKHYLKDKTQGEFYSYGVQQINMKKVLTIRTQYLFVNQTFFTYEVHIRFKNSSLVNVLLPGERLPIPESYNDFKFQIRISPNSTFQLEEQNLRLKETVRSQRINSNLVIEHGMPLDTITSGGRDIKDFQSVCKTWSDLIMVGKIKNKLPINQTTYLKHGRTYTIIKKEKTLFPDSFDITLKPPLLLKNCLPIPISLEFEDSNGLYNNVSLEKQEERHIFGYNLKQSMELKLTIQGFSPQTIVLDCQADREYDIKVPIMSGARSLDLYVATSSKAAGKKALFYVKSMVINNTQQEMQFYYEEPGEKQIKNVLDYKEAVAGGSNKLFQMLSDKQEIYASLAGSMNVSNPINIFNPGCNDKFVLTKGKELYEFSYKTEIYLACKDDYAYTKITTITPQYVIVNGTSKRILIQQIGTVNDDYSIPINGRIPFHWKNSDSDQLIRVKTIDQESSSDFDWTCHFPINELGQLSLLSRAKANGTDNILMALNNTMQAKYLKIDRRLSKNTVFIIIEEESIEQPTYKIENLSKIFTIGYSQVGLENTQEDFLGMGDSTPFAWSDQFKDHEIQIQLYTGDPSGENFKFAQTIEKTFSLDKLNYKKEIIVEGFDPLEQQTLYICTFTDGFTKVIRFSDNQEYQLAAFQLDIERPKEDENTLSMQMFEIYIKQLNLSIIGDGQELLVMYMQGIKAKLVDSQRDKKVEFKIGYFQIDNQSENDPIYPVLMKPKFIKPDPSIQSTYVDQEDSNTYGTRTDPQHFNYKKGVFELYLEIRKNVPNVTYFELFEYLLQTFEIKLELAHVLTISKLLSSLGETMDHKLTLMHSIFEANEEFDVSDDEFLDDEVSPSRLPLPSQQSRIQDLNSVPISPSKRKIYEETKQPKTILRKPTGQLVPKMSDVGESGLGSSPKRSNSLRKKNTNQQHELNIKKMREEQKITKGEEIRVKEAEDWKEEDFKVNKSRIYIREYRSSPVELEISLINRVSTSKEEESGILKTISSLGLLISSIDEAPIQLNALILENVFGDYYDVIQQIRKHHTQKLLQNVLKFIGASNLIGNPVNLVNALGTGIQDFYYQPIQGFLQGGVLEGGMGIISGTGSLMKNTIIGTMGSVSKISSSVSKGLLVLSNDKDYIYQRDVDTIKRKPTNVFQGLNLGFKSAMNSLGSGLAGVISKPIEETKKGGFLGFFKGTAQGVAGLVVKPISGTLDFISITSEGIKNNTKNNQELLSDKRLRLPRPFYEEEKTIRDFDEFHAFLVNLVPKLSKSIPTINFYDACMLECSDSSWSVLFLTLNHIALIMADQLRQSQGKQQGKSQKPPVTIKWVYETKDLKYIDIFDEKYVTLGFQLSSVKIFIGDAAVTERIKNKIDKIIKNFH